MSTVLVRELQEDSSWGEFDQVELNAVAPAPAVVEPSLRVISPNVPLAFPRALLLSELVEGVQYL
jgi:hypothetical protein